MISGSPMIARGSLVAWERDHRARLAAAEEAGELARMNAELDALRAEVAALQQERDGLLGALGIAHKVLRDLRGSRMYRLMRLMRRWDSLASGMRQVLG
jgi:hypothetical protein